MSIYEKHVFICTNERDASNPTGCCSSKGAESVIKKLKALVKDSGLSSKIRINKAGCLGQCTAGVTAVVYPEGTWYQKLNERKAETIFSEHLLNDKVVHEFILERKKTTEP